MGIAVAIIYLPIFIVCIIVSIYAGGKICDFNSTFAKKYNIESFQDIILLVGMVFTMIICTFVMWMIPIKKNPNWDGFIENIAISLFGPLSIGLFVFIVSLLFEGKIKAILRYYSAGALFSVPLFPLFAVVFLTAFSKSI